MSDPRQMAAGQPSQEEMRAYLEQLREADAAGLVAEAFNLLATGAQVKLGRSDARALIDSLAGMVEGAAATMPPQIVEQMKTGIGQLQVAQVQAERDMAGEAAGADPADAAGTDAESTGAEGGPAGGGAQRGGQPPGPTTSSPGGQRMTDRLWVPGRDPRPPGAR